MLEPDFIKTEQRDLPNDISPIYDISMSYEENFNNGPIFHSDYPTRPTNDPFKRGIFGFPVRSPLGIPAGPLLNSDWIIFASRLGFDILTYKTIRSRYIPALPTPNMIFIDCKNKDLHATNLSLQTSDSSVLNSNLALTNSFGVPSQNNEYIINDIAKANASLSSGQIMIVSVMGSAPTSNNERSLEDDFVYTSKLAVDAGAKIIELNFSCPNLATPEGEAFSNPNLILSILTKVKKEVTNTPIILKIGFIQNAQTLKAVMQAVARSGAEGICGINTIKAKIIDRNGLPALGQNRLSAGICGSPIRQSAIDFTQAAATLNSTEKLDLTILSTGGVVSYPHFDDLLSAGADIAMSAVGMMWNPLLAMQWHNSKL